MDKRAERELGTFLESLPGDRLYPDLEGPAVYRLEPTWTTAILCRSCHYIGLVLSIPRRPLGWRCPRCGAGVHLTPPLDVLTAKLPEGPAANPRFARRPLS